MTSFWKGFALGSLVFVALGVAAVNAAFKISYIERSLSINDTMEPYALALADSGQTDRLNRHLRYLAFSTMNSKRYYECMAEHWWFLTSTHAQQECFDQSQHSMPADWSPDDMDRYRNYVESNR